MKTVQTLIVIVAMVFATAVNAQTAVWNLSTWKPCDVIASPLGSTINDVQRALATKGVIGTERQGSAADGTYAMTFKDISTKNTIQLTFDGKNRLEAASTWLTAQSSEKANDLLKSLIQRIEKQGAKRDGFGNINLTDGSVSYVLNCDGTSRTITLGRNGDEPNVVWVVVSL